MTHSLKKCTVVLCCLGVLGVLPANAFSAPERTTPDSGEILKSPLPLTAEVGAESEGSIPEGLPLQLDSWGELAREDGTLSALSLSALPQGRLASQPPFIDFGRTEFGGFAGVVTYSSAFKAKADYVLGLDARVPVPGLPGNFGIWADAYVGYISRDLAFFYPNQSGNWFGGTVGMDYTFLDGEIFVFRGQAGVAYAYWNGVQSLDNGFGGTVGVDIGWYWIKHYRKATLNITPQITFNGSNYYAFISFGFQVEF